MKTPNKPAKKYTGIKKKMIIMKHKCGKAWLVSEQTKSIIYCPSCQTHNGFKEIPFTDEEWNKHIGGNDERRT